MGSCRQQSPRRIPQRVHLDCALSRPATPGRCGHISRTSEPQHAAVLPLSLGKGRRMKGTPNATFNSRVLHALLAIWLSLPFPHERATNDGIILLLAQIPFRRACPNLAEESPSSGMPLPTGPDPSSGNWPTSLAPLNTSTVSRPSAPPGRATSRAGFAITAVAHVGKLPALLARPPPTSWMSEPPSFVD